MMCLHMEIILLLLESIGWLAQNTDPRFRSQRLTVADLLSIPASLCGNAFAVKL